jgi:hypothetical protein
LSISLSMPDIRDASIGDRGENGTTFIVKASARTEPMYAVDRRRGTRPLAKYFGHEIRNGPALRGYFRVWRK